MLEDIFGSQSRPGKEPPPSNLLFHARIADELMRGFPSLECLATHATSTNSVIPSLVATLQWLLWVGGTQLPTAFYEAELDYIGKHMFHRRDEGPGEPMTGKHHHEWKPA
ncbi:MAG: hypothetical protein M1832_004984 [Thelocarpon impressellum]|nr:MAG: hypothetical protein M1832_004984 [Thelocarpon impressellum]